MPGKGSRSAAKAGGNTAPSGKTRPPGLGGQKAGDEIIAYVNLEDEPSFGSIAWFRLREAVARKVYPKYEKTQATSSRQLKRLGKYKSEV